MFRVLLVFAAISAAYSQTCPDFKDIPNNSKLLDEYSGTFYTAKTTSNDTTPCERLIFTGTGSERVAIIESNGCCRKQTNFNATNPDYVEITVTPMTFGPSCLQNTMIVQTKLVAKKEDLSNTCIVVAICRQAPPLFNTISPQKCSIPEGNCLP